MIHKQKYCSKALSCRCIWNGIHFSGAMLRSPGNTDMPLKSRAGMFQSRVTEQRSLSNRRYTPPAKLPATILTYINDR